MITKYVDNIHIETFFPRPEIVIWYCRIPDILDSILGGNKYESVRGAANKTFGKKDFTTSFLSDDELSIINNFKALKKQTEWISGRYLIKNMLQQVVLRQTPLDEITISYMDEGAPFPASHPDIPISLSHSNNYTVAACSLDTGKIFGVDIEKVAKKPDSFFLKTAFTQHEISNLKDDAFEIFKNWTIKEAYLKYIKKGFNESLKKVEIINDEIWHNKNKIDLNVYSKSIGNYVLSFVSN
jgi:4'-phosphopantetheinyl transferase